MGVLDRSCQGREPRVCCQRAGLGTAPNSTTLPSQECLGPSMGQGGDQGSWIRWCPQPLSQETKVEIVPELSSTEQEDLATS